jgi:ATP-binding cassette, subfamily B, bacterial
MISLKSLISQYKTSLGALLFFVIIVTALSLAVPNLTGEIIKGLEAGRNDWNLIWILGGVTVALFAIETLQVIVGAKFREQVGFDLRGKLMDKVTTQNYTKVNEIGIGQIITLFGSDVNNVKDIMAGELINSVKALLLFVGAIILLFVTNWKLGLIAFVSLPVIILAFGWIFKSVTKYFKLAQENQTNLNNTISQNVYGNNLIRVQNSQTWETEKYNYHTNESRKISFKIIEAFSALIPIINTITSWTTFGILYFGAITYIAGQIKLGDINAYITYYALLSGPIFIIGFNSQGIARMGVSLKRINELMNAKEENIPLSGAAQGAGVPDRTFKEIIKNGLEIKDVNLEYSGKTVLKNINLKIPLGQKTAILGPTGAGKSLLINLLTGMIKPTSGQVLVDDVEISNWDQDYIKDRMTTVFQESLIFSGDLRQNIVLNREFDQTKFDAALETSTLDELYKTKGDVSELGGNLSGGQKQRLTLARALYNRPQILLLDDFTARVDSATESKIQKLLAQNYPETTIVSISQSIETIKNYNQIILVMEGELLAVGTHEKLMTSSPEYRQIEASQRIL